MRKATGLVATLCSSLAAIGLMCAAQAAKPAAPSHRAATPAPQAAPKLTIGVVAPQVQLGQGNDAASVADSLRQSLVGSLQGPSVDVIPLAANSAEQAEAEAAAKHCSYVLYTSVQQKSSAKGFFRKLAPFASAALPLLGGGMAGGQGGGMGGAAAQVLAQSAMNASAAAAQQAAMQQLVGAQRSSVKAGDTVTLEYRLMAPGSAAPLRSDKLVAKAKSDGEDVLGPLIGQTVTAVSGVTGAPQAPGGQSTFASGNSGSMNPGSMNRMGSPMPGGGQMDCDQLAGMPNSIMSVASCKQMMATQQTYNSAAADPGAARPGDESMTCDQIVAEMKTMRGLGVSQGQRNENATAAQNMQNRLAKNQTKAHEMWAQEQAAVNAGMAADTATEVATGGLVQGHAAAAAQQAADARNRVEGEKIMKETQPDAQRLTGAVGNTSAEMSQELRSNHRYARLVQLAGARNCKGNY